jgi:hypothetical protein
MGPLFAGKISPQPHDGWCFTTLAYRRNASRYRRKCKFRAIRWHSSATLRTGKMRNGPFRDRRNGCRRRPGMPRVDFQGRIMQTPPRAGTVRHDGAVSAILYSGGCGVLLCCTPPFVPIPKASAYTASGVAVFR